MAKQKTSTAYGVFIIESLREGDFNEGERLSAILKIALILEHRVSVSSKAEFADAVTAFSRSGFRYLHLSCHANLDGIEIGGEFISNSELKAILSGKIKGRRVFFSACKASNLNTATVIIDKCKGQSVIGSPLKIDEDKAALFWPSFYFAINKIDSESMKRAGIVDSLQKCVDLFDVPINYYFRSDKNGYVRRFKIRSNEEVKRKRVKVAKV